MAGLIVTWDQDEIQAIDEDNFESVVVEVVDSFFDTVEGYASVEVEWKAGSWDHGSQYKIEEPPVMQINSERYFIEIRGQSRDGKYEIDMNPSGLYIEKLSTEQKRELDYLTLRAPDIAVNTEDEELFVKEIPKQIRKRVVETLPTATLE
ncbi:hypothetical protein [Halostella pelagica]|uniref:hypothetical protein n=1 Tax=Halostella pelagica TaxID=2583824 RepID=UPI001081B85F|nr:hypothetical protein [Halostella pelagica]